MEFVKKSFNMNPDVAQRLDDFIQANPGLSFTMAVNQAILQWLKQPRVELQPNREMSDDEVDQFMKDNEELMDDLSK